MIVTKNFTEPPVCKKEILRYAGCKTKGMQEEEQILGLLEECLAEVLPKLSYKLCYIELPLAINGEECDFNGIHLLSKDLAKNLHGCERVVLFAATIGIEIDRLITKYGHVSPAKAVMLQAIGAERIESLCDAFCEELKKEMGIRPRFSPGYGDLSLEAQKDIFQILNCSKNIGLSLNDSLLMSPSKSVTAFVGLGHGGEGKTGNKCALCGHTECAYRGV